VKKDLRKDQSCFALAFSLTCARRKPKRWRKRSHNWQSIPPSNGDHDRQQRMTRPPDPRNHLIRPGALLR
jgi:hypothetical protein